MITRFKEEDSLNAENVENLTNNMKIVCPTLDNLETMSNMESSSENLKDSDEKDMLQDSFNDKIARKPVESWKYFMFKSEDSRTSYKCSICTSVYQHKKSLNKHWKDKHFTESLQQQSLQPSSHQSVSDYYFPPSTNLQPLSSCATSSMLYPPSQSQIEMAQMMPQSWKETYRAEQVLQTQQLQPSLMSDCLPPLGGSRKRQSFLGSQDDMEGDENMPPAQARRLSLFQFPGVGRSHSMLLQPSNSVNILNGSGHGTSIMSNNNQQSAGVASQSSPFSMQAPPTHTSSAAATAVGGDNVLDLRQPNHGALDLRTTPQRAVGTSKLHRCFQCTFSSPAMLELNHHFKLIHLTVLVSCKSFRVPVSLYHKLLLNQFGTIVRTRCEPLESFNGRRTSCSICNADLPTRYEMIQHVGSVHRYDSVWLCLVCGHACNHPCQLSEHFQQHSNLEFLSMPHPGPLALHPQVQTPPPGGLLSPIPPTGGSNRLLRRHFTIGPHLASSTPLSAYKRSGHHHDLTGLLTSSRKPLPLMEQNSTDKSQHQPPEASTSVINGANKSLLKCLVCDTTARWRSELFTHMITHSEHRSFGCQFCNYRSKWKWDVPKHLKRCRLAPAHVRQPDVPNAYLITLLQHYAPPPGDILYEFMKEYNIKDMDTLNKSAVSTARVESSRSTVNESHESVVVPHLSGGENTVGASLTGCHDATQSTVAPIGELNPGVNKATTKHPASPFTDQDAVVVTGENSQLYSDISDEEEEEEDGEEELDVGTDKLSVDEQQPQTEQTEQTKDEVLKYSYKRCPWCQEFFTNNTTEMIEHIRLHHSL